MLIAVHSSLTIMRQQRIDIVYNPNGERAENGWPGARSITLTRPEALELMAKLDAALSEDVGPE